MSIIDSPNDLWRSAVDSHKSHAVEQWPREACGLISQDGSYVPCENIAQDPVKDFEISDEAYKAVDDGNPAAVLHSHVSSNNQDGSVVLPLDSPTSEDMASQALSGVPWGITLCLPDGATEPFWFGDQVRRPPLIGRVFRHGVDDCYSLIRDWYREVPGIILPNFNRDAFWWEEGQDLYSRFDEAGFSRVRRESGPLPGDVFLCHVKSPVLNHGGVYIGDGLILHHLQHQLSRRDPASVWRTKLDFLVRHRELSEDWQPC